MCALVYVDLERVNKYNTLIKIHKRSYHSYYSHFALAR